MKIGNNIRKMRELRNFTQTDMADKLSMSQNGYSRIERDETDIPFSRLLQISQVLEMDIRDLINFDENKILVNISHNQNVNNATAFIDSPEKAIEALQQAHKAHINSLENEILRLHGLLEKTLQK
jgi:transcriptional regulator with XRE-family HTH domain